MTEEKVIRLMRQHLEGLFPRICPNCKRCFPTLGEYLLTTKQEGTAMPYDADMGDWRPLEPLGVVTYANCPCGSTLTLTSGGMPLLQLWSLLNWARIETRKRGQTPQELLNYLRERITQEVLSAQRPVLGVPAPQGQRSTR